MFWGTCEISGDRSIIGGAKTGCQTKCAPRGDSAQSSIDRDNCPEKFGVQTAAGRSCEPHSVSRVLHPFSGHFSAGIVRSGKREAVLAILQSAQLLRGRVPYIIETDFRLNSALHPFFPLVAAPRRWPSGARAVSGNSPSIYSYEVMHS